MARSAPTRQKFGTMILNGLRSCNDATTTDEKGRALEDFIEHLFLRIPGIERVQRNTLNAFQTEEIDLAVGNGGHRNGLSAFPDVILVECKNWSNAVGSEEVTYFCEKLRARGCILGILIAMNGVTGDPAALTAARFQIARALGEKIRIIVLKREELEELRSASQFVALMKHKTLQLVASGTTI